MTQGEQNGVLYILFGDNEIMKECVHSARSLKKNSPGLPVQLITNISPEHFDNSLFDYIDLVTQPLHPLKAKVKYLPRTRFTNTLFLDADTAIRGSLCEIFDLAKDYDFAMTHDNLCDWNTDPIRFIAQQSEDINTGFLFYRDTPAVKQLLAEWLERVIPQDETIMRPGTFGDQWFFNKYIRDKLMCNDPVKTRILSNEVYNVRPWCWNKLKAENKFHKIKILHAHHLHHGFFTKAIRKIRSFVR